MVTVLFIFAIGKNIVCFLKYVCGVSVKIGKSADVDFFFLFKGPHLKGQGRGKQCSPNQAYNVLPAGVPTSFRFVTPTGGSPGRFPMATAPPTSPQYYGTDYTGPPAFSPNHHWSYKVNQGQRSWHKNGQRSGVVNDLSQERSPHMTGGESDRWNTDRGKRERKNSGKVS